MEFKIVLVLSPVDSLEVVDDIFMDVGSEWFGGLDLVVGGCVEVEKPDGSRDDLIIAEEVNTEGRRGKAMIVTHVRFFVWVDLERSKAGANIRWSDPFFASNGSTGIDGFSCVLDTGQGEARESRESKDKSDKWSERTSEHIPKMQNRRTPELGICWEQWSHSPAYIPSRTWYK